MLPLWPIIFIHTCKCIYWLTPLLQLEFHDRLSDIQIKALLSERLRYSSCGNKMAGPSNSKMVSSTDKISISMEVGFLLHRVIKGKGNVIESETGAKLIFPSSGNDYSFNIEGTSDSVGRASEKIQGLVDQAVNSPRFLSHFISLPLAGHPQLVDKLIKFQDSVLDRNPKGINKSIFNNLQTLHLTVLMLKLWNNERVNAAIKIFKDITAQGIEAEVIDALDGQPVSIRLKGLDCMEDSSEEAHVLYLPVEVIGGEDRLLRACKIIADAFTKGGLVLEGDTNHTLKLHVTVMNTIQRQRRYEGEKVDPFDARDIIKQYGSEEWGEYAIPEVHLSQRFKYDENGYYHCCASIPLHPRNMQAD